jgi:hypothetical protein
MGGETAWTTAAIFVAVLAPLVGVPLTVFTFHLKSLREQQLLRLTALDRRLDLIGGAVRRLREELNSLRRDAATKEEWLRESLWARSEIERLVVALARVETACLPGVAPPDGSAACRTAGARRHFLPNASDKE